MPAKPTLTVTPSNPTVGDLLVFTGTGYSPGVGVTVSVQCPSAVSFFGGIADATGHFSTAATETFVAQEAGAYTATSQQGRKKAVASFEVA